MSDFKTLWEAQRAWSIPTLGKERTFEGPIRHLKLELDEVLEDPNFEEFADCFLLLIDAAQRRGMSLDDVVEQSMRKIEINSKREWLPSPPDAPMKRVRK